MTTARVQVFHGAAKPFELADVPLPNELHEGEVLVEISLATICGSDLHTVDGRRSSPVPCILGHEAVGRVVESRRTGVARGQRVTWTLADSCGRCDPCIRRRLPQKCDRLFKYGHAAMSDGAGLNGCYASHILLRPGTRIEPIPETLDDAVVAPANCALATIVNALESLPESCERALVQGCGLLGIYACAWLRQRGVKEVFCSDVSRRRLDLAAEFGGIPMAGGERIPDVDLALEAVGSSEVVGDGVAALRPGGHYVWVGMVHPETRLDLTGEAVVRKCLTIRGVHNYAPQHLASALAFLTEVHGQRPFEKLVAPPLPLERLEDGLHQARRREWQRISICPMK